jgi:hypothetical protein
MGSGYKEFLRAKVPTAASTGVRVNPSTLPAILPAWAGQYTDHPDDSRISIIPIVAFVAAFGLLSWYFGIHF